MSFRELETRLLAYLNQMVRRGEISERQLARRTGYTQPHIHNVLKRARGMNTELADAVLRCLRLSLDDLVRGDGHLAPGLAGAQGAAPLWAGEVGPDQPFPQAAQSAEYRLFPLAFLARFVEPVLLRLSPREDSMTPSLQPGDLVLVDCAEGPRRRPAFEHIYALRFEGRGAVCRCQRAGAALVLLADNPSCCSAPPERIGLVQENLLEIICGRVVWTCREVWPSENV